MATSTNCFIILQNAVIQMKDSGSCVATRAAFTIDYSADYIFD